MIEKLPAKLNDGISYGVDVFLNFGSYNSQFFVVQCMILDFIFEKIVDENKNKRFSEKS